MSEPEHHDDPQWKMAIFRDRLRHSLPARFVLRFHVGLILAFSIFAGWLFDVLLLKIGLYSMAWRYSLSILAAYGAFLIGVYIWIEYSGIREYIRIRRATELVGDDVPRKPAEAIAEKDSPWTWLADPAGCLLGDGCLVIIGIFLAAALAFYFFGGFVLANATGFFVEIVLELLLAAGLLKGMHRYESSGWVMTVWRQTRWSLAFTLFVAIMCGGLAQREWPEARTFMDVVAHWHR
jgi:hypothetical protein